MRYYDENEKIEYCWYENNSSNVVLSWCEDVEDDYKELYVLFQGNRLYHYKKIKVSDYLMFSRGGLDGSIGKALNQYIIKEKYEYEKVDNFDLNKIERKKQEIMEKQRNNENTVVVAKKLFYLQNVLEDMIDIEMTDVEFTNEQGAIIYKMMETLNGITNDFLNDTYVVKNGDVYKSLFPEKTCDLLELLNEHFGLNINEDQDGEYEPNDAYTNAMAMDNNEYIMRYGDQ